MTSQSQLPLPLEVGEGLQDRQGAHLWSSKPPSTAVSGVVIGHKTTEGSPGQCVPSTVASLFHHQG